MSKVIIVGPNLIDQSKGQFVVHREGCADLKRGVGRAFHQIDLDHAMPIEAKTYEDVAEFIYSDHMDENEDLTLEACVADFHFLPCCGLTHRK